jgi:hypothetical protein
MVHLQSLMAADIPPNSNSMAESTLANAKIGI